MFTTLTDAAIANLRTMARDDHSWLGVSGTARPTGVQHKRGGTAREGMAYWLFQAQGGVCPTCGQGMTLAYVNNMCTLDIAHVVGAGNKRNGYTPGNVFLSHPACNVETARRHGALSDSDAYHIDLTVADFVRPELVPMSWPCATVGKFVQFSPSYF